MEQAIVSGVSYALDDAKVTIHGLPDRVGEAARMFTALAKAQPGGLTIASSGVASGNHLLSELLQMASGASWVTVQYKGGAPLMNDLLGGQVQFAFDQVSTSLPQVKSGRLRALAVLVLRRIHDSNV